jgi:hypothetical protein
MRYLFGFLCVCALVGTSPLNASAQAGEVATASEENLQEPAPPSEPAPEEPALQLKLDDAGVEVVPRPPRTPDGYTLQYSAHLLETVPVGRARKGLIGSGVALGVGGVLFGVSYIDFRILASADSPPPSWQRPVRVTGGVLMVGGAAGMIATGILLGVRKRKLRRLEQAHYGAPRRVQWDLARSRLVF